MWHDEPCHTRYVASGCAAVAWARQAASLVVNVYPYCGTPTYDPSIQPPTQLNRPAAAEHSANIAAFRRNR